MPRIPENAVHISIRPTREQRDIIKIAAIRAGLTMEQYIIRVALEAAQKEGSK